jgi:predicted amidohydrolase YtcJ
MNRDFGSANVAFRNGRVITVNERDEIAQAVAVKGNRIVFVGSDRDLDAVIDGKTEVIDLRGRTLMPGIIDSHFHPILSGMIGTDLDSAMIDTFYANCKSLAQMLDILKRAVAVKKHGQWVSMMGYEPLLLPEQRHPTIEELDAIAPENRSTAGTAADISVCTIPRPSSTWESSHRRTRGNTRTTRWR